MDFSAIDKMMEEAVDDGVFPAASLLVGKGDDAVFMGHYGDATGGSVFDVASLTKPVVTATLAMHAVLEGRLALTDTVKEYIPDSGDVGEAPLFRLLDHSSGLPAYYPFYREIPLADVGSRSARDEIVRSIATWQLEYEIGSRSIYSDLGYILFGDILEKVFDKPLNKLAEEKIFEPLEMKDSFFRPICKTPWSGSSFVPAYECERSFEGMNFIPTEDCPWRGGVVLGYVHDQNCYAMGGVAGHAGLFTNVYDLQKFVRTMFAVYDDKKRDYIPKGIAEVFMDGYASMLAFSHPGTHLIGWDRPRHLDSQAGSRFSRNSIGHLGYTGCSIWIDLEKRFFVILLSNRIHPLVTNEKIKSFRPLLHDAIVDVLSD